MIAPSPIHTSTPTMANPISALPAHRWHCRRQPDTSMRSAVSRTPAVLPASARYCAPTAAIAASTVPVTPVKVPLLATTGQLKDSCSSGQRSSVKQTHCHSPDNHVATAWQCFSLLGTSSKRTPTKYALLLFPPGTFPPAAPRAGRQPPGQVNHPAHQTQPTTQSAITKTD